MAVKAAIITVDVNDIESSINTQLTTLAIPATDFLQAVVLEDQDKNKRAKIVIFYEGAP